MIVVTDRRRMYMTVIADDVPHAPQSTRIWGVLCGKSNTVMLYRVEGVRLGTSTAGRRNPSRVSVTIL